MRKDVWVLSDFQEGTALAGLQSIQWPKQLRVHPLLLDPPTVEPARRVSLHWMPPDPHTVSSDAPWKFQIHAAPDFPGEKTGVVLQSQPAVEWTAPVTPGKVRTTAAPVSGGSSGLARLAGGEDFAGSVWVARPPEKRALIALQGGGDPLDRAGARYFMERGFAALGASRVELVSSDVLPVERDADVAMWVSLGGADAPWTARMRAGVERGALAFLVLSERADCAPVQAVTGESCNATEASGDGFVTLGQVDRDHPALAAFRSPAFSDFTGIRFWRHRRMELPAKTGTEGAKVVARFEGGAPAAVEYSVGKGHVLVWASGWRPADAQWVLSSRAVPFLSSCLDWALGGRQPFLVTTPGEVVVLPEETRGLRSPQGESVEVREGRAVLEIPGVYTMEPAGGIIVVNVSREESSLAPFPVDKLVALGVPVSGGKLDAAAGTPETGAGAQGQLLAQELEARQSVWRWVLMAVIVLLGIETVWAGRLSKKRTAIV
jgi:hypothetical protein